VYLEGKYLVIVSIVSAIVYDDSTPSVTREVWQCCDTRKIKNLTVVHNNYHQEVRVQFDKGPLIRQYLDTLVKPPTEPSSGIVAYLLLEWTCILPLNGVLPHDAFTNAVLGRFIASF
jgi:hypothetical protein